MPPVTVSERDKIGIYEFGEMVADHLLREYAAPWGLDLDDLPMVQVGDPAGQYRPARTGARRQEVHAAWEVLRVGSKLYLGQDDRGNEVFEERPGWGWSFIKGDIDHTKRQNAIRSRLTTLLPGGLPALVIDPRNTEAISGMAHGYHYPEHEDGTLDREPAKNQVSHLINAYEYCATRLFARPVARRQESDYEGRRAYASAASGSHRNRR
jgi:hypothetical protein